jgi:hypothetical protein
LENGNPPAEMPVGFSFYGVQDKNQYDKPARDGDCADEPGNS